MALTNIFTDIANAIREKNGSTDSYKPSEMAANILAINSQGGQDGVVISYAHNNIVIKNCETQNITQTLTNEMFNIG